MAAVGFNSILLLLVIFLFTTTMLFTKHQLANQVVGDDAASFLKVVEEGLLNENVGVQGRKLLGRMEGKREKMEKVDINREMSKRRSNGYNKKEKRNHHEDSGFVSLNSDYHPPRHHPPKNN